MFGQWYGCLDGLDGWLNSRVEAIRYNGHEVRHLNSYRSLLSPSLGRLSASRDDILALSETQVALKWEKGAGMNVYVVECLLGWQEKLFVFLF
jgi:hypothetical protein